MLTAFGAAAAVVLLCANGCFVALEQALAVMVQTDTDPDAASAGEWAPGARRRRRRRTGVQLGVTLCVLGLGVLAQPVIAAPIERALPESTSRLVHGLAVAAALALVIGVQIVLGELVPRSIGRARPTAVIGSLGRVFGVYLVLLGPLIAACETATTVFARVLRVGRSRWTEPPSRDDLRAEVAESARYGTIPSRDAELFERMLRLADKTAADALTPRVEVVAIASDATAQDLVEASTRSGLSRLPVIEGDLDHIVGMAHVKDVLAIPPAARRSVPVADLLREAKAVPEHRPLPLLMAELRDEPGQIAVVVDEYGGTAGLITLEDVLEELVGRIDDEHDRTVHDVQRWAGAHLVSGGLHRDELLEACGFELPEGDFETLGGFVMAELGRIPEVGDRIEHGGWMLQVTRVDRRRVARVRIEAPPPVSVEAGR